MPGSARRKKKKGRKKDVYERAIPGKLECSRRWLCEDGGKFNGFAFRWMR